MLNKTIILAAIAALSNLAWPTCSLSAQEGDLPNDPLNRRMFTPAVRAPLRTLTPAGFLSASSEESELQIEGGFQFPDNTLFGPLRLTLAATAPLDEDEEVTSLGGLDGLESGTVLSLSIGGMRWRIGTKEDGQAECRRLKGTGEIAAEFNCDANPPRYDQLPDSTQRKINRQLAGGTPVLYEITGKIARKDFGYLDEDSFEPAREAHSSRSIGGDVGVVLPYGTLLSAGLHYAFAYSAGPEAEICVPFGGGGVTRCRTGPLGSPTSEESTVGNLQLRRFLSRAVAINPRVTYSFSEGDWTVEFPIYLAPDENGGLIGGVAPGYDSEDEELRVRVFVGAAFRLGLPSK